MIQPFTRTTKNVPPPAMQWVEVPREEFFRRSKDLSYFKALQATIGTAAAQAFQNIVYMTCQSSGRIQVSRDHLANFFPEDVNNMFKMELDRIQRRKVYVSTLLTRAKSGSLRAQLAANVRPEADYYSASMPPPAAGRGGLDVQLGGGSAAWAADAATALGDTALAERFRARIADRDKAYRWVTNSWQGEGPARVLGELTKALATPSGGPPLGPDASMLKSMYKPAVIEPAAATGEDVKPYRHGLGAPYPSSVGGTYLLNWLFQKTSNITWPPQGDPAWEDYAVFFMGAIGAIQAFTDGNKRMSRLAYAIVMLKGGQEFKAPTDEFAAKLYRMTEL
jgi:hypothetical protein